jgi:hypothetical protein
MQKNYQKIIDINIPTAPFYNKHSTKTTAQILTFSAKNIKIKGSLKFNEIFMIEKKFFLGLFALIFASFGLLFGLQAKAVEEGSAIGESANYHIISLSPGWNLVSTPRLLERHEFSAAETLENFSVLVLNPESASGWSTMADLGQSEFTPLYGYFIENKTGLEQTLSFYYLENTEPSQRLFSRNLLPGWNAVGVAEPTYALRQKDYNDKDEPLAKRAQQRERGKG